MGVVVVNVWSNMVECSSQTSSSFWGRSGVRAVQTVAE